MIYIYIHIYIYACVAHTHKIAHTYLAFPSTEIRVAYRGEEYSNADLGRLRRVDLDLFDGQGLTRSSCHSGFIPESEKQRALLLELSRRESTKMKSTGEEEIFASHSYLLTFASDDLSCCLVVHLRRISFKSVTQNLKWASLPRAFL